MTIFDNIHPLGIGTNRFPINGIHDVKGIEHSVELMVSALNAGASYIDVAYSYSRGMAETVCKYAFEQTKAPRHVTIKSSFLTDKSKSDALRRIDTSFKNMGIDHATYFVIWNISSYEQFIEVMRKDSLYHGAVAAKERGYVDHICFSSHAPAGDIIKILESGAFEGATISYSILNSITMQPVLDCAKANNIGLIAMNPLGGGLIPQNSDYFSFLCNSNEKSVAQAALRFVSAHSAINIVLSGFSSKLELNENMAAFKEVSPEPAADRIERVNKGLFSIDGFCTGCRYCEGCPKGIGVYELMQSYNTLLLPPQKNLYNCKDEYVLKNIGICQKLKNTFAFIPESSKNPCVECGHCEKKCTAKLPIIKRIKELYLRFNECCFTREDMRRRLQQLIGSYRNIAFYPGAGYTAYVLSVLHEAFPETEFEISLFDSNPKVWGTLVSGIEVQNPDKIKEVAPQIIIVSNYNFSKEIYDSIKHLENSGIKVVKLHTHHDVPWVF